MAGRHAHIRIVSSSGYTYLHRYFGLTTRRAPALAADLAQVRGDDFSAARLTAGELDGRLSRSSTRPGDGMRKVGAPVARREQGVVEFVLTQLAVRQAVQRRPEPNAVSASTPSMGWVVEPDQWWTLVRPRFAVSERGLERLLKSCCAVSSEARLCRSEAISGSFGHRLAMPCGARFGAVRGQVDDKSDDKRHIAGEGGQGQPGRREGSLVGPGKGARRRNKNPARPPANGPYALPLGIAPASLLRAEERHGGARDRQFPDVVVYNDTQPAYNGGMNEAHVMTVSRNGQVSIPADTRARWNTRRVVVVDLGDRVVMRPLGDDPVDDLEGKYRGRGPTTNRARQEARAEEGPRAKSR